MPGAVDARYMQMNHAERIDYLKKLFDSKMSKAWADLDYTKIMGYKWI